MIANFLWAVVAAGAICSGTPVFGQQHLVPDTTITGPVLEFGFPGLHIGIAAYPEGPTGTTVFYFPEPVKAAIDVRGGAPGIVNSETLRLQQDSAFTNAVTFAGGSSYGLSAATGVAEGLKERWIEEGDWKRIADVTGAIIFDLGSRRLNTVTPDQTLGRAALESARPGVFPLGAQGAGRFTMQGWAFGHPQHSGQGGAFRQVGQTKLAVFTVVNPSGGIVDREGFAVRCGPDAGGRCPQARELLRREMGNSLPGIPPASSQGTTRNTTITLLVTNEDMPALELKRLAIQVHTSMGRAIQPFHTKSDGDVLIAVTTGTVKTEAPYFYEWLGVLGAEVAWNAVLASVPSLPESGPTDPVQWTPEQLNAVVGEYRFSRWAPLRIRRVDDALQATGADVDNLYFPVGQPVALTPVSTSELLVEGERGYRLRLEREAGEIIALTLEPGPWGQRAVRVSGSE
jgi:L-aminopeptidase/D-esterase-like protein